MRLSLILMSSLVTLSALGGGSPRVGKDRIFAGCDTIPLVGTLLSSMKRQVRGKEDSLRQSADRNGKKLDSLAPEAGHAAVRKRVVGPHGSAPKSDDDTLPNPAPTAVAMDVGNCKGMVLMPIYVYDTIRVPTYTEPLPRPPEHRVPFLTVHGNVMYSVNYYSEIDTPYDEQNVYQHTVQTYLDILVKDRYPIRLLITNRFSNSPLFHNYSDFNLGYTNTQFNQNIKDQVRKQYLDSLPGTKKIDSLETVLNNDLNKLRSLRGWMDNPALLQRMVEARERAYFQQKQSGNGRDSTGKTLPQNFSVWNLLGMKHTSPVGPDSSRLDTAKLDSMYAARKRQADSLQKEVARVQQFLLTARQGSRATEDKNLQAIQNADNPQELQKVMKTLNLSDSALPKGYKTLMAVKSFGVGRSVLNYSELSAKNISIDGVHLEYTPSNYYALASGAVDYRFRDFVLNGPGQGGHQYLNILRYGWTLRDGNSIILTYFQGKRQLFNSVTTDTLNTQVPATGLMGFTIQGIYKVTRQIEFVGEVAKSSEPTYVSSSTGGKGGAAAGLFNAADRSNEAYSLAATAFFPETQTRVKASYKHLGENYQSFSVFTDGSAQGAWSGAVDQPFFKRQLDVNLSAYTNDFSNPYISQQYNSRTLFESIQVTLRRPRWPVFSVGYSPSSQITELGPGVYQENLFYTFTGNATYSYRVKKILMNTTLVYTQFYNRAADSGFVYFDTKNLLASQSVYFGRFTLQGNVSAAENQSYDLFTLEGKVEDAVSKSLTLGGGLKYNDQTVYNIQQWGYSGELMWRVGHLGQIQFTAEKGFIPGMNNQLVPNNTGRLTYIKTF